MSSSKKFETSRTDGCNRTSGTGRSILCWILSGFFLFWLICGTSLVNSVILSHKGR